MRNYLIIDWTEKDLVNWAEVETCETECRKSLDGTKCIIKWDGDTPDFVENLTTKSQIYTLTQLETIITGPDWFVPFNPN